MDKRLFLKGKIFIFENMNTMDITIVVLTKEKNKKTQI